MSHVLVWEHTPIEASYVVMTLTHYETGGRVLIFYRSRLLHRLPSSPHHHNAARLNGEWRSKHQIVDSATSSQRRGLDEIFQALSAWASGHEG